MELEALSEAVWSRWVGRRAGTHERREVLRAFPEGVLGAQAEQPGCGAEDYRRRALVAAASSGVIWLMEPLPLAWLEAGLASAIHIWAGLPFYRRSWADLRSRRLSGEALITGGVAAAWLQGMTLTLQAAAATSAFVTATALLALAGVGRWLEAVSTFRASEALRAFGRLEPSRGHRLVGGNVSGAAPSELRRGERCRVLPGERLPADGRLETGEAVVIEAFLRGEGAPAFKREGDPVYAGTLNAGGPFTFVVEAAGEATLWARAIDRLRGAIGTRARLQARAEAWAGTIVAVAGGLGVVAGMAALAVGSGVQEAVGRAIAVWVTVAPGAWALVARPVIWAGLGSGAWRGIVAGSAEALERGAAIHVVALDQAGALSRGEPEITEVAAAEGHDVHEVLDAAASLMAESGEPLAKAVLAAARAQGILPRPVGRVRRVPGQGAIAEEALLALGSAEFLRAHGVALESFSPDLLRRQHRGESLLGVGMPGGALLGGFAVADRIKPGAARAIEEMHALGVRTALISPEGEATARAIARLLRIEDWRARVPAEEKGEAVADLQERGGAVAFVGEPRVDAAVLAQADLGLATGVDSSPRGVALLAGDPLQIAEALRLGRTVRARILGNVVWLAIHHLGLAPLAAAGLIGPLTAATLSAATTAGLAARSRVWRDTRPRGAPDRR